MELPRELAGELALRGRRLGLEATGGQYSTHADFVNAWTPSALCKLVDDCLNALVHCGRG